MNLTKFIKQYYWLILIVFLGLIIRISLNNIIYSKDAESFVFWGYFLKNNSIVLLYTNLPGDFTPLPPIYYYITRLLASIASFFGLGANDWLTYLIFKIPPYSAEVIATVLIFSFSRKYISNKGAFISSVFYFLNPAIVYNSAVFGQIDSFVSVLSFTALLLLISKKYLFAYLIYVAGFLSKLQILAIAPIFALVAYTDLWFKKLVRIGLILSAFALLPFLPVLANQGFVWTIFYFKQLPNWYPYTSVYTYNLWAPAGFLTPDNTLLLGTVPYRFLGLFLYLAISAIVLWPFLKSKCRKPENLMFAAFLLFFNFAFFETRIHSRYLIYSFVFLAPFAYKFPLLAGATTFLMIADLLLPVNDPRFSSLVGYLRSDLAIWLFVLFGLSIFAYAYSKFRSLIMS